MIWRCMVCGYRHVGDLPPQHCPICNASSDDFELIVPTDGIGKMTEDSVGSGIASSLSLFRCPLCQQGFVQHEKSLLCPNRHTFDMAKQGYVNFVTRRVNNDYDKAMLGSRRRIIASGFFMPLLGEISKGLPSAGAVLDAGCGEGSHLAYLMDQNPELQGIGIDLSKDGILLAAGNHKKQLWAVADLTAAPFQSGSFSAILNILSPANYLEFQRLLSPNGRLFKIIPGENYLQELRDYFYEGTEQSTYSNEDTTALFHNAFPKMKQTNVRYSFAMTPELLPHIVAMTPLTWNAPKEKIDALRVSNIPRLTLDFTILQST